MFALRFTILTPSISPAPAESRIVPVIEGGIGGAKLSVYINQQTCATTTICINQSQFLTSSNHFQVHGAVGVKFYVKSNMFIKPQVDFHYVPNLNQQYSQQLCAAIHRFDRLHVRAVNAAQR